MNHQWIENDVGKLACPSVPHLKKKVIESARRHKFGAHEPTFRVLKKMFSGLARNMSHEVPIKEFKQGLRNNFGLSEQEAYDLSNACDDDCDGQSRALLLTDMVNIAGQWHTLSLTVVANTSQGISRLPISTDRWAMWKTRRLKTTAAISQKFVIDRCDA